MIRTLPIVQCMSSRCRRFIQFELIDVTSVHMGSRYSVRCICGADNRLNVAVVEDLKRQEKEDAPQKRQEPQDDQREHPRVEEERAPTEASGGDRPQEGREEQGEEEPFVPSDPAWDKAIEAQRALNSHGSLSAAARSLNVTPPTIKNRIALLTERDKEIIAGGAVPPKPVPESSNA